MSEARVVTVAGDALRLDGPADALAGGLLELENGQTAWVAALFADRIEATPFRRDTIAAGDLVRSTRDWTVPTGAELLGRVIDPLGRPLDDRPLDAKSRRRVRAVGLSIGERSPSTAAIVTGNARIDLFAPIRRGQYVSLCGDQGCGKSTTLIDIVLAQRELPCVYALPGVVPRTLRERTELLRRRGALEHTVIVASPLPESAPIAHVGVPAAALAIAEELRDVGRDVVVVIDDLGRHASAWSQLQLPGVVGYKGELQRLLERTGARAAGGSITTIAAIRTRTGDLRAPLPAMVTELQEGSLRVLARRSPRRPPALDLNRSSRPNLPPRLHGFGFKIAPTIAWAEQVEAFAAEPNLREPDRETLERVRRIEEWLDQPPGSPRPIGEQIAVLAGLWSMVPLGLGADTGARLARFLRERQPALLESIGSGERLTAELSGELRSACSAFG